MTRKAITIIETKVFTSGKHKIAESDLEEIKLILAYNPEAGDIIPGSGGVRKLRIGQQGKGKGKRGGYRVIYYYHSDNIPVYLFNVYAKNVQVDISASELKDLKQVVDLIRKYIKK